MKALGVIIARGGSKRLPGKNLRALGGKPLIAWSIAAADGAKRLARTIVSTDDQQIAAAARSAGGEVPFLRPAELATDLAPVVQVLQHATAELDHRGFTAEAVVLLQATSPFRSACLIDAAVARFIEAGADTLTSVRRVSDHPYWIWRQVQDRIEPFFDRERMQMERSMLPDALVETGTVYVVRRAVLDAGSLYGDVIVPIEVAAEEALDIDTLDDFRRAEAILAQGGVERP